MHLPKIIGITGRSGAGKSTVARIIKEFFPQYSVRFLSAPVKDAVSTFYGFTPNQLEFGRDETDSRWNLTPDETIRSLTNFMTCYMGSDFFTRQIFDNYKDGEYIIIPDLKCEHDIFEVQKRCGTVIKVERNNEMITQNVSKPLKFNYLIRNNGTIHDVREDIINEHLFNISRQELVKHSYS